LANGAVDYGKLADSAVITAKLADQAVTLAKLEHGTSSNNGKFLRANNGADPTFETVNTDLVSDTSPQLGGDLDANSHNILFNDSYAAKFGDSNDLLIYHEGGSGDNVIKNNVAGKHLKILQSNNDAAAVFYNNTSVALFNAGVKKFETTTDGYYYYGTITGGTGARSNAGITQTNVFTPAARLFTGGYGNTDQNVTVQGTTGNWQNGSSSSSHRSSGILFNRISNNVQQIRAGLQFDINGTEKFKIHASYGDIHFRTRSDDNGNKTWEDCDKDPLILHNNGHVAMMHMPYIYWIPGGDDNTYQTNNTEHVIDGSTTYIARHGMSLSTSNGRITVPYTGVYQVNASIGLYRSIGNTRSRLNLMKNGSDVIRQEHANENRTYSDGGWKTFSLAHTIELSANDYLSFDCVGKHDSGNYAVVSVVMLHGTTTT